MQKGETRFKPLPVRWVVERTYSWQGRYRCLSKDYEHTPQASEGMIRIAAIHHLLQRLRHRKGEHPTASASGSKHTENDVVSIIWNRVLRLANNEGWVSVGVDHDTAEFAVASIGRWWQRMGCQRFPQARQRFADHGGWRW